ncbi:hypothetical protein G9A89_009125 [Geosiphon pyriformis]|nr:hypothetical protein G9A89_009125 [Geosiphon pyriformis]
MTDYLSTYSPSYAKLIEKCWDVNPENCPTAREVFRKLLELDEIYWRFKLKSKNEKSTDEVSMIEESTDEEFTDIEFTDIEFTYEEAKTVSPVFRIDKNVKEMINNDSITNLPTTITTITTKRIHPGAGYTHRLLT